MDGRPLTAGYFGNVDLSKILLADVREIAIIKGPASAQYGGGSMGGVVNLITNPQDNLISLSTSISRNLRMTQRLASAKDFGDTSYSISLAREDKPGFVLSESFEPTLFENGKVRDH
ncbi:MAG: TonB-dependent receptor plug domain-containing protein, partial [Candidatus Cloacimonetes bacterium]|nr:TonB-dependent receptor plug domain-containing protein [Candidatus Cloacimonadota bacterium]